MRIHLKTGLICLALSFSMMLDATAESDATPQQAAPTQILSLSGEPEGYLSLAVAGEEIDATLVSDKLGRDYGTVLLLHDEGGGIDSRNLIHTLRLGLPEVGWSTMTVALHYPRKETFMLAEAADEALAETKTAITDAEPQPLQSVTQETELSAEPVDNLARVSAAFAHIQAQTDGPVIVLGIGSAAPIANQMLTNGNPAAGLIWLRADSKTTNALPLETKMLDITASRPATVRQQAQQRQAEMRRHNTARYIQRRIAGADPFFYGYEESVLGIVRGWLYKHYVEYTN